MAQNYNMPPTGYAAYPGYQSGADAGPSSGFGPGYGAGYGGSPTMGYGASSYAFKPPSVQHMPFQSRSNAFARRTINIVGMCLSLLVPWIIFCLINAMMTFYLHYRMTALVYTVGIIVCIALSLLTAYSLFLVFKRWVNDEGSIEETDWISFLAVTTLLAALLAMVIGSRQFAATELPYFDIASLNHYDGVNVTSMRGQQLMDAGRVKFVPGTYLDTKKSMGFKNGDTFCVAPITGGFYEGNPALFNYDFWAVGINCCSSGSNDFKCGQYKNPFARAGLRLMKEDQRPFFRLAVQQALSTYMIQASHPLFFHWVQDPEGEMIDYRLNAFKYYMIEMLAHFGLQLALVIIAALFFRMPSLFPELKM